MENKCEHKYAHLDTSKSQKYDGRFHTHWKRIDRFYCEKCLNTEERITEDWTRDKPDWY